MLPASMKSAVSDLAVRFQREFDCIVILSWSKWHSEPRSNRYHYATRFARLLPVIFVQPFWPEPNFRFEETDIRQFTVLHLPETFDDHQSTLLHCALRERGLMRPLFWVYCPSFIHFL